MVPGAVMGVIGRIIAGGCGGPRDYGQGVGWGRTAPLSTIRNRLDGVLMRPSHHGFQL